MIWGAEIGSEELSDEELSDAKSRADSLYGEKGRT
jgi:hypothetical protein